MESFYRNIISSRIETINYKSSFYRNKKALKVIHAHDHALYSVSINVNMSGTKKKIPEEGGRGVRWLLVFIRDGEGDGVG